MFVHVSMLVDEGFATCMLPQSIESCVELHVYVLHTVMILSLIKIAEKCSCFVAMGPKREILIFIAIPIEKQCVSGEEDKHVPAIGSGKVGHFSGLQEQQRTPCLNEQTVSTCIKYKESHG